MADEVDLANDQAERWLKQALASQTAGVARLQPKGCCHFCEHPFEESDPANKLFCDKDCASDYEEEQRLRNRR